jgi:hypothetical protein
MYMAALANDAAAFNAARLKAEQAIRDMDDDRRDPKEYVIRSFASMNPLLKVTQFRPTKREVAQILATIKERAHGDGYQAVLDAIRLHNHYSRRIGGSTFTGTD